MNARPDPAPELARRGEPGKPAARPRGAGSTNGLEAEIFREVQVRIGAHLGEATLTVEELLALEPGAVLKLDRQLNELVDLYLNDTLVARGEIVAVDDSFGVRIVEVRAAG